MPENNSDVPLRRRYISLTISQKLTLMTAIFSAVIIGLLMIHFMGRGGATRAFLWGTLSTAGLCLALGLFVANSITRQLHRMMRQRGLAEAEIRELNQQLEKRVSELRFANKELESFSYSVSHDLRAPLRAIDGFSRILTEEHPEQVSDEGRRLLAIIRRNVEHMSSLIDGLLSFSRLSLHALERRAVDMDRMVNEVIAELKAMEAGRAIQISVTPLGEAYGDETLLRHIWINLISNAIKFTRHQAEAVISIGQKEENGLLVFHVRDNGAGFDMKYADKLFGVFQRLHSMEEFEGTGIGLALVQRIVTRHGGTIWGESRLKEGATFYFTLPKAGVPPPAV